MRLYAGLGNYVVYASMKCTFLREWLFVYDIAMKITLTANHQYGGSGEMACLALSAI